VKLLGTLLFFTFFLGAFSQTDCSFIQDTVTIPKDKKVLNAEYLQTVLKNKSIVQLYKTETNKYYLKLIVTENLYFNKVDMLEIKSGSKSFFAKETRHYQFDKHTGFYLVEIYKNYAGTLKDDGITSIVFGSAETNFSKQDCNQVKQISKCFYENIVTKK
jgi:hypothetical protein